jgi:predicted PurR-regulated permease PerM
LQDGLIQLLDRLPESFQPAFPTDSLVQQAQPLITWAIDHFFDLFSNALVVVFNLLLILVLTVMLLVNPGAYRQGLIRLFPSFYRQRVDAVLTEYEDKLVRWMRATLWKVVIVGAASALGLWLLQVPLVLTNAVLAGLLETIPHVGVVLSLIPPFAAAGLRSPEKAVTVVGLYLLIQLLKQVCLEKLEHRHPDAILPAVVLLAQLSLAFFCGFSGLLLAVPLLILAQVGAREILVKDLLSPGWKSGPPLKRWGRPWKSQEEHVAPQQQSTLQEEDPDRDGR